MNIKKTSLKKIDGWYYRDSKDGGEFTPIEILGSKTGEFNHNGSKLCLVRERDGQEEKASIIEEKAFFLKN